MAKGKIVSPDLYSTEYYLSDNEGWEEYRNGLSQNIHPKFVKALAIADPKKGQNILDIGCGRGELLYYCVARGAKALWIDYSAAAIEFATRTIKKLPKEKQRLAEARVGDIGTYNFQDKYDTIFMIEIAEHMHDWQLTEAFRKIKDMLKPGGRLIIMTPNYYYEKYLSPIKGVMNVPLNIAKWPFRALRGKFKPIFRIRIDRGELNRKVHVNISTVARLKRLLVGFQVKIRCEDHSKNFVSLLTAGWWGREIIAIATKGA